MLRSHLNDILIFMAVVDRGSFVAGGEAMGLTRSAAGKAVGRLEDRLGARLLNRTTRALSLTDEGRTLYDHGSKILEAIDNAEASVAGPGGAPRGVLRLTVPDAFGRLVVLPVIQKYLAAWPEVQVEVNLTDRLAEIVDEGFDLALRIGAADLDAGLVSRVVATYRALICASPAYLAEHGEPRTAEALAGHECLIFSSRTRRQSWRLRDDEGEWMAAEGRSRLRMDSGEAIRDAAVAGLGLGLLPEFLVDKDLAAGRLRQVLPDVDLGEVKIVAIYPTRRHLEPRVRRFIDLLVEELGSDAPQGMSGRASLLVSQRVA